MPSEDAKQGNDNLLRCPHCGALFMAKHVSIGKRAPCRECKQSFTISEEVILKEGEVGADSATGAGSGGGAQAGVGASASYSKGDLVYTDMDGRTHWDAARVSDISANRLLLTMFSGRQFYTTGDHVRPLVVAPGCAVLSLDEKRGAYVPGVVQAIERDAVCVSDIDGATHWRSRGVVFPDTVDIDTRIVRRDSNGKLKEVGRICRKSREGYRIRYDDGIELPWADNARGGSAGIIPGAVSPGAPHRLRSLWRDRRCIRAFALMTFVPVLMFFLLLFGTEPWWIRLGGSVLIFGIFSWLLRTFGKSVPRVFLAKSVSLSIGIVVVSSLAIAFLLHEFREWPQSVTYGLLALGAGLLGAPRKPRASIPKLQVEDSSPDDLPDRRSDYHKGERVQCLLPNDPFLRIGVVQSVTKKQVEVAIPGGDVQMVNRRDVFSYEVAVQQRVVALRTKLNIFLPAVITHIRDDAFTVRFDDSESASCTLDGVWFPCRKEVLKMGPAKCQAMLEAVATATSGARATSDAAEAQATLAAALAKYPYEPSLHLEQAIILDRQQRWAAAAAEAYEAVKSVSADSRPYTILGNAYIHLKRYVEAEEAFRAALNLSPDDPLNWQNVGRALLQQGEEARAGSFFSIANQLNLSAT